MKRILLLTAAAVALITGAVTVVAHAQTLCHDEFICTPFNGCRWVTVCR